MSKSQRGNGGTRPDSSPGTPRLNDDPLTRTNMKSNAYAALDAAILSAITTHEGAGFSEMLAGRAGREANALGIRGREPFRILDARLQAMRRAGRIKSVRSKIGPVWVLAEGAAA